MARSPSVRAETGETPVAERTEARAEPVGEGRSAPTTAASRGTGTPEGRAAEAEAEAQAAAEVLRSAWSGSAHRSPS